MPVTKTVTLYRYDELSDKAKKKAIDSLTQSYDNAFDGRQLQEYLEERLVDLGFGDCELHYSLSHCQGDGVAFYGTVDLDNLRTDMKECGVEDSLNTLDEYDAEVEYFIEDRRIHYHHYNSMRLEVDYRPNFGSEVLHELENAADEFEASLNDLVNVIDAQREELAQLRNDYQIAHERCENAVCDIEEFLENHIQEVSHILEREGYKFIESLYSEESLLDFAEANDILFDEDGDIG